jgi:hypothetical protein
MLSISASVNSAKSGQRITLASATCILYLFGKIT